MKISHTDRNGKPWVFSIECTPYQAEILKNTLRGISNIGGREKLTIRYYRDVENEIFCRKVERALLLALTNPLPMCKDGKRARTKPMNPRYNSRVENEIDDEDRPRYYWENF